MVHFLDTEDWMLMNFYDAIYMITLAKRSSLEALSIRLGKTANYISTQKSRGSSPKVDTASKIAEACGYVLCAIPNESVPESAYVLGSPVEEA